MHPLRLIGALFLSTTLAACSGGGTDSTEGTQDSPQSLPPEPSADTVATQCGTFRGSATEGVVAFKGLPYARPPIGALRWQPPAAPVCPLETRVADAFAPACAQLDADGNTLSLAEDCLYLNVWTPSGAFPSNDARPVLFFIHGGGNQQGSTSTERLGVTLYDGSRLAAASDAVIVTVGYRLGALGFLAHPALSAESADQRSGNYGLLDQIAALNWVQDNIAAFGGDPQRVTIFGESGGARDVCSLVASPLASGLFHGAIMQSGGCRQPALAQAEADGMTIARAAGCDATDSADCLRSASVQSLLDAIGPEVMDNAFVGENIGPVVDNHVLLDSPETVIAAGAHNIVPLIIGANADETGNSAPLNLSEAEYTALIRTQFGVPLGDIILARYPASSYASPAAAYVALSTDVQFICPARRLARAAAVYSQPVYAYRFAKAFESTLLQRFGAFHGIELIYLFQQISALQDYTATTADLAVESAMADYWGAFAHTGDANGGTNAVWEPYSAAADNVLQIAANIEQIVEPRADECAFWDTFSGP